MSNRMYLVLVVILAVLLSAAVSRGAEAHRVTRQYPVADLLRLESVQSPADAAEGLVSLVENIVAHDTWRDNGGRFGDIRVSGSVLVVRQSADSQATVGSLLELLRGTLEQTHSHLDYGPNSAYSILHRPVGETHSNAGPMLDAIERLKSASGCAVRVDRDDIEQTGRSLETPVTFHLWDASVGDVLDAIFRPSIYPDYEVRDGAVHITIRDQMPASIAAYDIRPIIGALVSRKPVRADEWMLPEERRQDVLDAIETLVENEVATDSWKDNGGAHALAIFGGALVAEQTFRNHRQLASFLSTLAAGVVATTRPATAPTPAPSAPQPLDDMIDDLQLDDATLDQAIDTLATKAHANIVLDREELSGSGVLDTTIVLHLRNVHLRTALDIVLELVSPDKTLGYAVREENVILVSKAEHLSNVGVIRIYNVRDLVDRTLNAGPRGAPGSRARLAEPPMTRQDVIDSITKTIEDTVNTDAWKDNGGSVGSIRELNGLLIISATGDMHKQIDALLAKLRTER